MRRPVAVFEMLCVRACMPCSESLGELFAARGASGVIPPSLRRQASVRPPCCRRRDRVPRGADSYTIRYGMPTHNKISADTMKIFHCVLLWFAIATRCRAIVSSGKMKSVQAASDLAEQVAAQEGKGEIRIADLDFDLWTRMARSTLLS